MNWIKQNKFLASIAGVAILLVVVLGWYATTTMLAAGKSVSKYKSNAGEANKLYSGQLYPSQANLKAKQEAVAALRSATTSLHDALAKQYGAGDKPQDHVTFGQRVQRRYEELRKAWEAKGLKVPEDFFLGLERYREKVAASKSAVRHLDHQLDAISRLITVATDSGLTEILRLERGLVPGEDSTQPAPDANDAAKSVVPAPARYPLEILCSGREESVRGFINHIAASDRHFFAFKGVRLQNEMQTGPEQEKVRDQVKPTADDVGAGGGVPDIFADSAPAPVQGVPGAEAELPAAAYVPPVGKGKDAYQFLGNEHVKAVVSLDLVVFEPRPDVAAATEKSQPLEESKSAPR